MILYIAQADYAVAKGFWILVVMTLLLTVLSIIIIYGIKLNKTIRECVIFYIAWLGLYVAYIFIFAFIYGDKFYSYLRDFFRNELIFFTSCLPITLYVIGLLSHYFISTYRREKRGRESI